MLASRIKSFWSELKARKVIRVAVVYAIAGWVVVEVASVVFPGLLLPDWTSRLVLALVLLGFPIAVGLAWAFQVTPEGIVADNADRPADIGEGGAESHSGDDRLDGWKRIAQYLNRDVRTLRRWELKEGLPVHRLMHDKQGTVYAFRSDLDNWRANRGGAAVPATKVRNKKVRGKLVPKWVWLSFPILIVGVLAMNYWPVKEPSSISFGEWDWVLITRFDNRTGESVLDDTLEYAMQRELANSAFVKVAPRERINDALALMKLPGDTEIDIETGREISLRDGGIRVLITGRIEKLGGTYALSSELINSADGVTMASFSAEASGQGQILAQVRILAQDVRAALGEGLASIEATDQMLAKVTTPSLEALQLFSEANRMMSSSDRPQAAPILEQAVRVDPDFASAHLLLVYLYRDRDEVEKAWEHLRMAVELAEQASERERLFILATYYRYLEDLEKELETYHLLLRLYPDHLWANGNLGNLYESTGQFAQAYLYKVQNAEWRPNQPGPIQRAVELAMANGEPGIARKYLEQMRAFEDLDPYRAAILSLAPVYMAWTSGDYVRTEAILEEYVAARTPGELVAAQWEFTQVRSLFLALGKIERFRQISALRKSPGWLEAMVDRETGRPDSLAGYLETDQLGYWSATLHSLSGQTERAGMIINNPRSRDFLPPPFMYRDWKNMAKGHLAFAQGRMEDAVDLLSTETMMLNISAKYVHLFSMHTLAKAHQVLGNTDAAIRTLEQARLQKPLSIFSASATWFWLRNQFFLQQLYTDTGQTIAAKGVQAELRDTLQLADEGHPFLQFQQAIESNLAKSD